MNSRATFTLHPMARWVLRFARPFGNGARKPRRGRRVENSLMDEILSLLDVIAGRIAGRIADHIAAHIRDAMNPERKT